VLSYLLLSRLTVASLYLSNLKGTRRLSDRGIECAKHALLRLSCDELCDITNVLSMLVLYSCTCSVRGLCSQELGADWSDVELSAAKRALEHNSSGTVEYETFKQWWLA
jgi:hypothetical protein